VLLSKETQFVCFVIVLAYLYHFRSLLCLASPLTTLYVSFHSSYKLLLSATPSAHKTNLSWNHPHHWILGFTALLSYRRLYRCCLPLHIFALGNLGEQEGFVYIPHWTFSFQKCNVSTCLNHTPTYNLSKQSTPRQVSEDISAIKTYHPAVSVSKVLELKIPLQCV
jgi:hypothetical protein